MIPLRLELKNFLPYRSPDPLRFEGIHLACLTGPNGAGKSSLLDAITWALWGRARAKRDEELIHMGQSDMYIQLDFEQEGVVYRVLRRRARSKRATGTLDLFILENDKPRLENEPSMRATQDKINRILRLDYETFVHSAFLQQGKADAFTTKNPAERKRILSDILGLDRWARYEDRVKDILKTLTAELEVIDLRIQEIDTELLKEPRLRDDVTQAECAHEEAKKVLEAAEAALREVEHAPGEMRRVQEVYAGVERRLSERQREAGAVEAEIKRHQERIALYEETIATRAEIEAGYAALQSARQVDSSLSEKLQQLSDYDAQRHDLQRALDAARAELENERSGYLARIAERERLLAADHADDLSQVQAEVQALQAQQAERDRLQELLGQMGEERARLETENTALRSEMFAIKDQLDRVQQLDQAICPLCGQPLSAEHREQLIAQLTDEGKQRGDAFRANQTRLDAISADLGAHRAAIRNLDLELKRLSPLTERMGVLQAQMDAANDAALRLEKERAGLKALETVLENETFAEDLRGQLRALTAQRDALGYDRQSHTAAREQLSTYQTYEGQQRALQNALENLPEVQGYLETALDRQSRLKKNLEDDQAELERLKVEIEQLDVLVREQQMRLAEANKQRAAERMAYQRLVNAQQELRALEQQRTRKAELEARRENKRHEEGLYNELKKAFGKNGIPAMIIETAIPELEATANDLLGRMTDGRMALRLTTQREKITGGTAETLEIEIADELGTRNYEMYSGGEAFRIDFAIRVALSQMLARRAGAHLRTLFIDEGFGTQDDDGRNKLVEAITAVQESFDLILVITHIDDLRDSFPVHVVVEKTANGSRVSLR